LLIERRAPVPASSLGPVRSPVFRGPGRAASWLASPCGATLWRPTWF